MALCSELLRPGGPLSRAHAGYEARQGQLEMADAVQAALASEHVLLCEAGTGTGKTLAYLLPALTSGKRVVIATATRALQDQLLDSDLPLAEKTLGRSVRAVVMKGLPNYLCLRRFNEAQHSERALLPGWALKLGALRSFRDQSTTGDLSELVSISEDDEVLAAVRSGSDTRLGAKCTHFAECFVTQLRERAEAAELIITNHHLFFADLALRGPHPGRVLPNYDAVIFDEAHQLEDVATQFFGVRVSRRRIDVMLADAQRLPSANASADATRGTLGRVENAAERFFAELTTFARRDEPRSKLEPGDWSGPAHDGYLHLDTALDELSNLAERAAGPSAEPDARSTQHADAWGSIARRCQALRDALATIVDGAPGRVTWIDNSQRTLTLSSSAVDLSGTLRERLFDSVPSVVLTSATLTASPAALAQGESTPFAFVRSRLGAYDCVPEVKELIVSSPFDFKSNALLYVPKHLPEPSDPRFVEQAALEIVELVTAADGGAFVLTTSLRSMRNLHAALAELMPARLLLLQGNAPKHALLASFRQNRRAVLVATMSFWEGVDVPGDALRLVILEKIPFAVPSDPILQARAAALEADGERPFNKLFIPLAQMTLKQGFGRLIRTQQDRGVVALFDRRVTSKGYGQTLLSQLPPARRTHDRAQALEFLSGLRPA